MEPKNFYLKAFNLTKDLSEFHVTELCNNLTQKVAKKNDIIYSSGGENKIYILVSGRLKISEYTPAGDEMIKELILPGDLFGDVILGYNGTANEYAEVISERATYFFIGHEQLASQMLSSQILTMNYLAKLGEKFKSLESRYVNMATQDVKSRLLNCFKEWAKKDGMKLGDKVVIKNTLTHNDLANLISTSRQTVTVILNELKESGAISYNRREIKFSRLTLAG